MKEPKTIGVIVGRFQTPSLHIGHRTLIENVLARHDDVLIVLGTSAARLTANNPLDVHTRMRMIELAYPTVRVAFIADMPSDDAWSTSLDEQIGRIAPESLPILYGNRDSFLLTYTGQYEYRKLAVTVASSASELRASVGVGDSEDFRKGVIYAANTRYPVAYQTVDVAIIDKDKVLLGKKLIDGGKFRFIGGFVDPSDASLEYAARREVSEETSGIETADYKYLGSHKVADYRYPASSGDGIMTAFFSAKYIYGAPQASDDLDDIAWCSINDIYSRIVPEHARLADMIFHLGA